MIEHFIGGFLLEDVDGIIDGYYADEALFFIDNGDGEEIKLFERVGNFFLGGIGGDADGIFGHDFLDNDIIIGYEQIFQADHAFELAAIISDIERIDGFFICRLITYFFHRLADCHASGEGDILGSHDTTCSFGFIAHEDIGDFAFLGREGGDELFGYAGGELIEEFHSIVRCHFIDEFYGFLVAE